jgi:multidrug efflux system membrane fusion protein
MTTNTSGNDLQSLNTQSPAPVKGKKRGFLWAFFLVLVIAVTVYAVWRASQPGLIPANPNAGGRGGGRGRGALGPTPVGVAKVKSAVVPNYLSGLGNVTAFYTVSVKSRVDGQLMSIAFKEGDFVKEGQVLAEIDPRPYKVQLDQAEGTAARDQALLANAKLDLERYKTLLAQDAIPRQQLDTQAALVQQLTGTVKQDQAAIDNAKLNLTYAHITAPISGRIGLRLVDPGNIVRAVDANGILIITQLQPITVLFTIPEDSLPQVMARVSKGAKLTVEAWNRDNSKKIATGTLITVDNQIDQTTGTSKMKAVFDNKDNALFPNQFVNVKLLVDTMANQMVVPSVAIQHGQQGDFVFVVPQGEEPQKVVITPIKPGIVLEGDQTSVASGLNDGDQVVIDGTDRLQNGSPVRIRKPGDDGMGGGRGRGRGGRGGRGGDKGGDKSGGDKSGEGRKGGGRQQ